MLSTTLKVVKVMGICDACDTEIKVETFKTQHGLFLCQTHFEAEQSAYATSNAVVLQAQAIDATVDSKDVIFNVPTIAMEEIRASIYQDDTIPEDKKVKALADVVAARIDRFKKEIFEDKVALRDKENHLVMLTGNMQSIIGQMKEIERAGYRNYEINYKPPVVKKPKSVVGKTPKSVTSPISGMSPQAIARASRDAAAKYPGVDGTSVQATAMARHMSFDDAAKFLAELMGLV